MPVSEKQRAANRRNAQLSSGPTSKEGKARSSQNARLHGLTALLPEVGPEAEQARLERLMSCIEQFRPQTGWQSWLVEDLADATLKLGRISVLERQLRGVAAARADSDQWDEDRNLEAEILGARLKSNPSKVVAQLRQSPHGCDWLIGRWSLLARIADTAATGWDDAQKTEAYYLLGTPATGHSGPIGCQIDSDGRVIRADLDPADLAREQIAELQATRDRIEPFDAYTRSTVVAGWSDLPSHDAVLLRRYEIAIRRRLTWIMAQLKAAGIDIMGQFDQRVAAHSRAQAQSQPQNQTPPPTPPPPPPPTAEAPTERPERNEPISAVPAHETKPISATSGPVWVTDPTPPPTKKRPDPAKILKRERKARRKRAQNHRQG